jgi:hypothetical protein
MGERSSDGFCRKETGKNKSGIMYKLFLTLISLAFLASCNNQKETDTDEVKDNKLSLNSDTLNVVKLTDTLVIYESTCRGCAYESSTHFSLVDSLDLIKLDKIVTVDNNSSEMSGGNISKQLILVPVKTGSTILKLYKFWDQKETAKDSANVVSYKIEIKN